MVDAILIAERIEIAWLCTEVLDEQQMDPREALVLIASKREDAPPLLLGVAERAQSDVDFPSAEGRLPMLGIIDTFVPQLPGTRRHSDPEGLRKALQRIRRHLKSLETRVTDGDR